MTTQGIFDPLQRGQRAVVLADRVLTAGLAHFVSILWSFSVSARLASWQSDQCSDTLFAQADEARLQAKRLGHDRRVVFDSKEFFSWP